MITVRRSTSATPEQVWSVIADGWSYPSWVVGASRMRAVESEWPAVGSRIHHSVGTWPLLLNDETVVQECEPGRRIVLIAKARPYGKAWVEIELSPQGQGTMVQMREDASAGPAKLMPKPARQAAIGPRNVETLKRLLLLAERQSTP
ncbi:SRPBCC family protein [Gephyromycinifex aptenodytis]|uniref:SRPBCC family protein n=1 Tax=Gephyromycinifex aptenodytis TaxID=2716227 RepID=UPI001445EF59|nr:SRPBCC family protein [Gephyromycinifex aptenodytis]